MRLWARADNLHKPSTPVSPAGVDCRNAGHAVGTV
jgi:hypothetical protein